MRTWIPRLLSKLIRQTPRSTSTFRPTLEQLEDRCVPSANMMPSMGMTMQPMNMQPMSMQTTNMPSMGTNTMGMNMMNNGLSPSTVAALDHLFTDFIQTGQQVMSSQSLPQFFANEMHMIQILRTDIAQFDSSLNAMG